MVFFFFFPGSFLSEGPFLLFYLKPDTRQVTRRLERPVPAAPPAGAPQGPPPPDLRRQKALLFSTGLSVASFWIIRDLVSKS